MDASRRSIPSVGIVIVNRNSGEQLQRCVVSIEQTAWSDVALAGVAIVDNASTDGSVDSLRPPSDCSTRVIRNVENRGFGAACNLAAKDIDADFLLFLNPDAVLEPDSIPAAVAWLSEPAHATTGIVGIQLMDEDGRVTRSCARFPTTRTMISKILGLDRLMPSLFPGYVMEDWDHCESRDVDHVIGAFYLVRTEMFRMLRGFDETFFVYFEDLDFSARSRQVGFTCYYLSTVRAFHKGGGTSSRIKSARLFYSLRSRIQYAQKHFSKPGAAAVTTCTLFLEPGVRMLACVLGRSPTGLRETISAYRMLWRSSRGRG